jgi:homoserine kinase
VTARVLADQPGKVVIEAITGDGGRLSLDPAANCVGIAATETLKLLGSPSCGVSLTLDKVGPLAQCMCHLPACRSSAALDHGVTQTGRVFGPAAASFCIHVEGGFAAGGQ